MTRTTPTGARGVASEGSASFSATNDRRQRWDASSDASDVEDIRRRGR